MNRQQLEEQLHLQMIRISLKGKYTMLAAAEAHDITLMQAITLCLLDPDQPVPMNRLSTFMGCDPSNVTGIVDRLVSSSFIERKESVKDRRIKTVTLTAQGLALRKQLLGIAGERRLPNISALSDKELEQTLAILDKAS